MDDLTVASLMTECPALIGPETTLKDAAREMQDIGCGALPVGSIEAPLGIITDRDIVVRAVARGKDVRAEKVRDYMTREIFACHESDSLASAEERMRRHHVGRLLVLDDGGRVSGILTYGAILRRREGADAMRGTFPRDTRLAGHGR